MPHTPAGLAAFNALDREGAEKELLACCASRAFAREVAAGRPYPDQDRLADAAGRAVLALGWPDVLEALGAHPRIGERPAGDSREAAWSRREQAGVEDGLRAALAEGNRAYEDRFGHVYLVCATGLTGAEMLRLLRERLGHDEETERRVVREELAKITRLRAGKLAEGVR
ncbi:2-oxo-4-hydroxy-4-carboxy-5-ureidoimidazoline decarboxylase [Nonomuraea sp. C10]|uniref:2-oxo-4-hydroxy-4-carboxy-5-ureidoimidazoline decarboxylase n=1 Tax=Nonomuraea sp. C10 TaxID=2600577 RepID=UPI0011CDB136|nr:2-oxo-4-hydroxy-4-carboxy-5-ureidoimidazoline decarboxylase [Nonomuraea sp. C10]TXK41961.1 2-oxo-4-hydroxy-4-carboxy-5-ureidoimidazoline decarboxylase [Nonomuraea sp. C10]